MRRGRRAFIAAGCVPIPVSAACTTLSKLLHHDPETGQPGAETSPRRNHLTLPRDFPAGERTPGTLFASWPIAAEINFPYAGSGRIFFRTAGAGKNVRDVPAPGRQFTPEKRIIGMSALARGPRYLTPRRHG